MNGPRVEMGTDLIEIERFRSKPLKSNLSFYNSIFTCSELEYCLKYSDPYPHLAGIFAAKESIVKCSNVPLNMIDIEISHDVNGKPSGNILCNDDNIIIKISISHTHSLAIAVAASFGRID
jgi:holo-[acyl-carrier protein] synthase